MDDMFIGGIFGSVLVVVFIAVVWILREVIRIQRALKVFFQGSDAKSLESTILEQLQKVQKLDEEVQDIYTICSKIHALAHTGLFRVGIVRFNPFKDIGGDQSFAVALLDGKGNGVVFSSLFTKSGSRVYAKPVLKHVGTEMFPLTDEELQAITVASPAKFSPTKTKRT